MQVFCIFFIQSNIYETLPKDLFVRKTKAKLNFVDNEEPSVRKRRLRITS